MIKNKNPDIWGGPVLMDTNVAWFLRPFVDCQKFRAAPIEVVAQSELIRSLTHLRLCREFGEVDVNCYKLVG
jgi:hypothetical protein